MPTEPAVESGRRGLGRQAARGALLTVGAQAVKIVVQVAGVVVLARLLTPSDYGLVAMVLAVIGVAEIFRDFGLSSAAIQAASLSRAQREQSILDQHRGRSHAHPRSAAGGTGDRLVVRPPRAGGRDRCPVRDLLDQRPDHAVPRGSQPASSVPCSGCGRDHGAGRRTHGRHLLCGLGARLLGAGGPAAHHGPYAAHRRRRRGTVGSRTSRPFGSHAAPAEFRLASGRLPAARVPRQQRRLSDHRHSLRRGAARPVQPRLPVADDPAGPTAGADDYRCPARPGAAARGPRQQQPVRAARATGTRLHLGGWLWVW